MMDYRRYQAELQVLNQKMLPNSFKFFDMNTSNPYVLMAAVTNRGRGMRKVYTLRMDLENFPYEAPYVSTTQLLYTKSGKPLDSGQSGMHCLWSEHGGTGICHYGSSWNPSISLYKVFIKCRLWLEMYELHLQTGMPIGYYLKEDKG